MNPHARPGEVQAETKRLITECCERQWTQSYYVGTAELVSAETIKRYILECQGK